MPKATWNGVTLAESDDTVVVEGNHYFPAAALDRDVVRESDTHTVCPWKGTASYYTVEVDGQTNERHLAGEATEEGISDESGLE